MDENPIEKTIDRMNEGLAGFFWDAFTALTVIKVTGDYVEFGTLGVQHPPPRLPQQPPVGWGSPPVGVRPFEGLPPSEDPRDHPSLSAPGAGAGQGGVGEFERACAGFGVPREAYTAVEGYFEDTPPPLGPTGDPRPL